MRVVRIVLVVVTKKRKKISDCQKESRKLSFENKVHTECVFLKTDTSESSQINILKYFINY
jgi:hypothetical protein